MRNVHPVPLEDLDRLRRRQEEEAALRQEMERRNAAAEAREEADRAALAAAIAAAAAAARAADHATTSHTEIDDQRVDSLDAESSEDQLLARIGEAGGPSPGEADLQSVMEGTEPTHVGPQSPSSEPISPPDWLLERFPSFSFPTEPIREPLFRFARLEAGAYELYKVEAQLNPLVGITPSTFNFGWRGWRFRGGWEGNRVGLSISTPSSIEMFDDGNVTFAQRNTATFGVTWDGWNSSADVQYSTLEFSVATEGDVGYSGSGAQGIYVENKPVKEVVIGLGLVVGLAAAYFLGPQVYNAVEQWFQRLPVLQPAGGG